MRWVTQVGHTNPGDADDGRGTPWCARHSTARPRSRIAHPRPHGPRAAGRARTYAAQTRCTLPHSPSADRTPPPPLPPPRPHSSSPVVTCTRIHSFTHKQNTNTSLSAHKKTDSKCCESAGKKIKKGKGKRGRGTHQHRPTQLRGFFQKEIKSVAKPAAAL